MNVSVKICGIRSVDSALSVIDAGADFIGLNFVPSSKRKVTEEVAREITAAIKGQIKIVGVFQNGEVKYVNETADSLGLDFVQLHGSENASYCEQIHTNVIKAVSLKHNANADVVIKQMQKIDVPFFLLDREIQGKGDSVNLEIAQQIAREFEIFLAGGLNLHNVAHIVSEVRPFAVDVAGGIETDGKEDFEKIKLFIRNAKTMRHSGK